MKPLASLVLIAVSLTSSVLCTIAAGAEVSGRVLTDDKDRPVNGVKFDLILNTKRYYQISRATTDVQGRFWFTNIPPGSYRLILSQMVNHAFDADGPFAGFYIPREGMVLEVFDADVRDIKLVARRGANVVGQVFNEAGEPLVRAMASSAGSTAAICRSDKEGRFTLAGFGPGHDAKLSISPLQEGYFYTRVISMKAHDLQPGATIDVGRLSFKREPEKPNLKGTFTDANGQLLTDRRTFELWKVDEPMNAVLFVHDGRFERAVLPGKYRVTHAAMYDAVGKEITTIEVAPTGVTEVEIKLGSEEHAGPQQQK